MTEAERKIEFARQFDSKEQAEAHARRLGSRWHVCKSYRQKDKFQLSYDVGDAA